MTSIGLRPALLFFSLAGVNTAASISARKLSNGTTRAIISSGSPFRGNCRQPLVRIEDSELRHRPHTRESCCHYSDSHKFADVAIFRGALAFAAVSTGHDVLSCEDASSANTTLCPGSMSE